MDIQNILQNELKGSFDFFLNFTNLKPGSSGFGLTADCTKKPQVASIAASGFALSAWVIAAERGYLTRQRALEITQKTLHTLLHHASHHRGFFAHFLDMATGQRIKKCEYSTIDTALCLNGVITAEAYFQDAQITELAQQLLDRGWPADTPAAVILGATTGVGAQWTGSLGQLPAVAPDALAPGAPGTIVIGEVVRLAAQIGGLPALRDDSALPADGPQRAAVAE